MYTSQNIFITWKNGKFTDFFLKKNTWLFIVWTIIYFFPGNTNHSILFLYIFVIVCANLTRNAVIFKRLSKELQMYTSLLIDFCDDYRPYLCWQVSCILFSIIIPSFDFNLSKSLISRSKKITSHHASGLCLTQLDSISLSQKVDLHRLLDLICPSIINKYLAVYLFTWSYISLGWLAYHLWRNMPCDRTA